MHPRDYIVKFCDDLKIKLLDKYNRGEKEHGESWGEVDCQKEVLAEIVDILNYFFIHKAQKDLS